MVFVYLHAIWIVIPSSRRSYLFISTWPFVPSSRWIFISYSFRRFIYHYLKSLNGCRFHLFVDCNLFRLFVLNDLHLTWEWRIVVNVWEHFCLVLVLSWLNKGWLVLFIPLGRNFISFLESYWLTMSYSQTKTNQSQL